MRFLVIDAVAAVRSARVAALRELSFEVAQADGVTTAMRTVIEAPHAILFSFRGTRESLAAEVKRLRAVEAFARVPLVVLGETLGHAITALSSGADDYWEGSMDEATFRLAVRLLHVSRTISPSLPARAKVALVADDEPFFREVLSQRLRSAGLEVVTASGGAELLRLLEAGPRPALVVTDFYMPGLGGQELLRRLHDDPRLTLIPVIVVSGERSDAAFVTELKRLHAKAFVEKSPAGLDSLVDLAREQVKPGTLVRRRTPRAVSHGLASFRRRSDEPWLTGFVYNLGPTGAFLRTTIPAAEDTQVQVRLEVPQGETRVFAAARVAWSRTLATRGGAHCGMGVQFADLSAEAHCALEDAIALHPPAPPHARS